MSLDAWHAHLWASFLLTWRLVAQDRAYRELPANESPTR